MEILLNIGIGLLGVIIFIVWNSREYIMTGTFSPRIHIRENWKRWAWAITMLVALTLVIKVDISIAEGVKSFTGLDFTNELGSYFTAGSALAAMVKGVVKKIV